MKSQESLIGRGKHILWTHRYFASTIGDVSEKTLKKYIESHFFKWLFFCTFLETLKPFSAIVYCKLGLKVAGV